MITPIERPTHYTALVMPPSMWATLQRLGRKNHISASSLMRTAIDEFLARELKEVSPEK